MTSIIRKPSGPGWWAVLLAVTYPGLGSAVLWAQPPSKTVEPARERPAVAESTPGTGDVAEKKAAEQKSIGDVLLEKTNWTGWTFYAIEGSVSILALSIILERLFNLRLRKLMPRRFVRRVRELVARHEDTPDNLRNLCESFEVPIANVIRAGLLRAGQPLPQVEKAMEDALGREAIAQRGRNRMLAVIAYLATLIGLLGTVVGMILAFRVTSQIGTGKAEMLAEGIYLALLRTAFGIGIAVPSYFCANLFNTRLERILRNMIEVLEELIPTFTNLEQESEKNAAPLRANGPMGRLSTP